MMDGVVSDDEFSLNPGAGGDGEEDEAPLRAALHYSIGEICSAQEGGLPMTASAVSTLAEVVFKYTEALALDLRVFAKHGKRAVVGVDDVKCVARKDPKMVEKLASFESARNLNAGKKKAVRKKKDKNNQGAETAAGEEGGEASDVLKGASAREPDNSSTRSATTSTTGGAGAAATAALRRRWQEDLEHEEEEDPHRRSRPSPGRGGGGNPDSDDFVDLRSHDENYDSEDTFASARGGATARSGGEAAGKAWAAGDGGGSGSRGARFNGDDESDDDLLL